MKRLSSLLCANNSIARIGLTLDQYIPNLKHLVLTNNKISTMMEIEHLAQLKALEHLCLLENPVFFSPHYRLFTIYRIPSLKSLDYQKIRVSEREEAKRIFTETAEGKELLNRVLAETSHEQLNAASNQPRSSSSLPPPPPPPPKPAVMTLTESQKLEVREAISNATSKEEVDRIEQQLRTGTFPFRSSADNRGVKRDRSDDSDEVKEDDPKKRATGSVGVLVT